MDGLPWIGSAVVPLTFSASWCPDQATGSTSRLLRRPSSECGEHPRHQLGQRHFLDLSVFEDREEPDHPRGAGALKRQGHPPAVRAPPSLQIVAVRTDVEKGMLPIAEAMKKHLARRAAADDQAGTHKGGRCRSHAPMNRGPRPPSLPCRQARCHRRWDGCGPGRSARRGFRQEAVTTTVCCSWRPGTERSKISGKG